MVRRKKKAQVNLEKGQGVPNIAYVKSKVTYRCTDKDCKKVWQSVHGWKEESVFCEFCCSECKIVKVKEEKLLLDNYACPSNHRWQAIHEDSELTEQECEVCEELGSKDGTQERHGRHFWFVCKNKRCGVEWEDFSVVPQRTQNCGKTKHDGDVKRSCGKPGVMIKIERIYQRRPCPTGRFVNHVGSKHNTDLCDMCNDLKKQGFAKTCMSSRNVTCKVERDSNGDYEEKIIGLV